MTPMAGKAQKGVGGRRSSAQNYFGRAIQCTGLWFQRNSAHIHLLD